MKGQTKLATIGLIATVGTVVAIGLIAFVRSPHETAAMRGHALALANGCFACHGPGGTGGVPNPASDTETVPAWDGGTAMMYVENENEIREWILYGRPHRLAERADHADHEHGDAGSDRPLLQMPAFKDVLSRDEVDDLVAYYKAVARFDDMPQAALTGYRVATRLGCFGCHGAAGRVGAQNPRSFKGYIPPWHGKDYDELVRDSDELKAWILDGEIDRFASNPAARFFTERQIIHMPAYRGTISDEELEAIVAYISWLQEQSQASSR